MFRRRISDREISLCFVIQTLSASLGAMMSENRTFKTIPRVRKRAGGSYRARARHLLRSILWSIILIVQHALALPLVLNTSAAIAARASSETSTFADPIHKKQSTFLTASQYGTPSPVHISTPAPVIKKRALTIFGYSLHEQKPMPSAKYKLIQTSIGERKRSARWRISRSTSLKTECPHQ